MRPPPPLSRPSSARSHANSSALHARTQSGAISPANSVASGATNTSRSPTHRQGGIKRKERDFDGDGNEETNIHVVVRCRGRNDREVKENSGVVVSTEGVRGKSVDLSMGPSALSNKTYHFDKVFAPAADQSMIYDDVVTPILDEMLQGYNCTIFAYGQTGTGKTYTMSGDMADTQGLLSESAGIIPRALHSLFQKLEAEEAESSVKCSFIELYNEELRDLLSGEESTKLKIYEDGQKKGHNATLVHGMEESHIKNAGSGIKLLQKGSHKRQVAATKCNDLSSRSHTVFTVTVYIKRTAENGEDFVSAGKLNLVDLAGSENIQRSGAENKRAAEAGLINKSLLTLGRVINALVDKSSHIPYRESKLTRLLQDSLGGRTKTCIIATVSPAKSNLEETISTLDYAFRAKNIRNKPQINQTISKKTLLREFTAEIEKLKSELIATRQRNGVYLTTESYEEITGESESRRILTEEQKERIETMEIHLRNKVQELFSLTHSFTVLKKESEATRQLLDDTKSVLEKTEIVLSDTRQHLDEETSLRKAHQATEEQLSVVGGQLISTLGRTVVDIGGLHAKIGRESNLQDANRNQWHASQHQVSHVTKIVESRAENFQVKHEELLSILSTHLSEFATAELKVLRKGQERLESAEVSLQTSKDEVISQASTSKEDMNTILEEIKVLREQVKQEVGQGLQGLSAAAGRISAGVITELEGFNNQLYNSYHSLGRDFKSLFEDLVKHLNVQKAEADQLRRQLSAAAQITIQSDKEIENRLQQCLAEEREQAAADRQNLLLQITNLVDQNGTAQEARLSTKINGIREDAIASRSALENADALFSIGMAKWTKAEDALVEEVVASRSDLKNKIKTDWTAVNEHNVSIQTTTKSVHQETVRIVDAQMKEMAVQMQALDEFVTKARSQNEQHYETHVESLGTLGSMVRQSYTDTGNQIQSAQGRIKNLDTEVKTQTTGLTDSLSPLSSDIKTSLGELRTTITTTPLVEYIPTGETPQKQQYQYPTALPRTRAPGEPLPDESSTQDLPIDFSAPPPSPSKSIIYNDCSTTSSTSDRNTNTPTPSSPSKQPPTSLREINLNIPAGHHQPNLLLKRSESDPKIPLLSSSLNSKPTSELLTEENTKPIINTDFSRSMGPPPLKRHATMMENSTISTSTSKLPQKFGKAGSSGRENAVPVPGTFGGVGAGAGAGAGSGRRLRSSPTG